MSIKKLNNFYEKITYFFSKINHLAIKNNYFQRVSKINPFLFIKSIIEAQLFFGTPSLKNYSETFENFSGTTVSTTGFDKRITKKSIGLLKDFLYLLLELYLSKIIIWIPKLLKGFSDVLLLDSTYISLPEDLQEEYKGFGGNASESGLKIQCLYSFFDKKYQHFDISAGTVPDQSYGCKIISSIKSGSLLLFDLGYVTLDFLKALIEANVYYVCRFPDYRFKLYTPDNKRKAVDLLSLLKANKNRIVEFVGYANKNARIPIRVIAFPLKKTQAEERKKKAIENAKRKNRVPSKKHLEFLQWSIFCTNAGSDLIKTKDIFNIYRLRWRIELIFKLWKSKLDLNHLSGYRKERILFELYAKLLALTFYNLFFIPAYDILTDEINDLEVSEIVCINSFRMISFTLLQSMEDTDSFQRFTSQYIRKVKVYGQKSKSKKKKSTMDLLNKHVKGGFTIMNITNANIELLIYGFLNPSPPKKKTRTKNKIISYSKMSFKQWKKLHPNVV